MSARNSMSDVTVDMNDIQHRAGYFAELAVPGPHKDKRLGRMLECTPNMAYRLRRGRGWTADRLALAAKKFGWRWVHAVFGPIAGQGGNEDVFANEIASLRSRIDALSVGLRAGPFPVDGSRVGDSDALRDPRGEDRSST